MRTDEAQDCTQDTFRVVQKRDVMGARDLGPIYGKLANERQPESVGCAYFIS